MRILSWRHVAVGASLLIGANVAQGQTKSPIGAGSWIVGGSANISHNSVENSDAETSIALAPSVLYFVAPRWALGGSLDLGYAKVAQYTFKTLGIGPEIRYYIAEPAAKTLPFLSASVQPLWSRQDAPNNAFSEHHELSFGGSAGLTQLLAAHVGLTGELFYSHRTAHAGGGNQTSDGYGLRFGITAFVF